MYVHTHTYVCICVVCICVVSHSMYVCIYTYTEYIYISVYIYTHTHIYTHMYVHIYIYVCMAYVHMHLLHPFTLLSSRLSCLFMGSCGNIIIPATASNHEFCFFLTLCLMRSLFVDAPGPARYCSCQLPNPPADRQPGRKKS